MLEIEKDQNLLKEFGRIMTYLASVEYLLGEAILVSDKRLSPKDIHGLSLGPKIGKIKESNEKLSPLITELRALNKDRKMLAHGIIGGKNGLYVIHHHGENKALTIELLQEVTKKAQKLRNSLSNKIWKKVSKNP